MARLLKFMLEFLYNPLVSKVIFYKVHFAVSNKFILFLAENMTSEQRRENYLCDITYVTNSELGFDYLRDNLATESNSYFISWSIHN